MEEPTKARVMAAFNAALAAPADEREAHLYRAGCILVQTMPAEELANMRAFARAFVAPTTAKEFSALEVAELVRVADLASRVRSRAETVLNLMWRDAPMTLRAALADLAEAVWSKEDIRTLHLRGDYLRGGDEPCPATKT